MTTETEIQGETANLGEVEARPKRQTYLKTDGGQKIPVGVLARRVRIRYSKAGPIYAPFLDDKVIDYIAALIKEEITDGFDSIVMITGRRRTGKSTLGLQIARKVSPKFSIENVAFRVEDFSSILNTNPYADVPEGLFPQALLDEAGHGLYSKEWMSVWQRNLVKCLEVIGMKNQVCYFILPHMRKLTGDVRDEMAHIWIDVDTKYKHERGYAELYMGNRDKFKQSIWWTPKCAFKFNELQDDFWVEYEKKKRTFVDEVASEKITESKNSKDAVLFGKALYKLQRLGVYDSIDKIAEDFEVGRATVFRRLAEYKSSIEDKEGQPTN